MTNTIFIYSKTLNEREIEQFSQQTAAILLKQAVYLDYKIAFFSTNLTACELRETAQKINADISDLTIIPTLNQGGLLLMDMDSTAIKIECIDDIAKLAGTGEVVSAITAVQCGASWISSKVYASESARWKMHRKAFCKKCGKIYRLWTALSRWLLFLRNTAGN